MKVPYQTSAIFEVLGKGGFLCGNTSDKEAKKLFDVLDDPENFELLAVYFEAINFILEKGEDFFYFSRKGEPKSTLEKKLETVLKWIDIVDFFKCYDENFMPGFSFSPSLVEVRIGTQAILRHKADALKQSLNLDEKMPYGELANKAVKMLCDDGFAEPESTVSNTYKVLTSFRYIEELVNQINITEDV